MVHTLPDYTSKWKMNKISANVDNAELAARLGSPVTFDRRGNVVWYDDFEGTTLNWRAFGTGGATLVAIVADRSWTGSQSAKLTTGATTDDNQSMFKQFHLPSDYKLGFEAWFDFAAVDIEVTLVATIYTGTYRHIGGLELHTSDNSISYIDAALARQPLGTMNWSGIVNHHWMPVKLVVDYASHYYVRAIVGNEEFDMSAIPMNTPLNGTRKSVLFQIEVETQSDNARCLRVDNCIFTQNEL